MRSEDFDKRIKDAAEHHFPAYDETAWKKMHASLDKHLPQEGNDRRRLLLVLLFVIILGGGAYLLIGKPWKNDLTVSEATINKPEQTSRDEETVTNGSQTQNEITTTGSEPSSTDVLVPQLTESVQQRPAPSQTINNDHRNSDRITESKAIAPNTTTKQVNPAKGTESFNRDIETARQTDDARAIGQEKSAEPKNKGNEDVGIVSKPEPEHQPIVSSNELNESRKKDSSAAIAEVDKKGSGVTANEKKSTESVQPVSQQTTTDLPSPEIANLMEEQQKMARKKFRESIGLTFSLGPDVSGMPSTGAGEITANYGLGISYKPGKRWLLRMGVQVSDKIYSAAPEDYRPPKDYWTNYVNMLAVDANCRIVEMPLLVSYNLTDGKKGNLFVTAGLSSYFMKKEYYYYHYYDQWGQYQYGYTRKENGKNHFLSVVTAGAGYSYSINERFSLMAEPYVKLPLAGVGFGKIKLKSGGVLFTATYNPFR